MTLVEVKTAELIGPALDWAVAQIEGETEHVQFSALPSSRHYYAPSRKWAQGGPLIEKHRISVMENLPAMADSIWEARGSIGAIGAGWRFTHGPTPLIAAMRCLVASKLGDTVQVPEELLP